MALLYCCSVIKVRGLLCCYHCIVVLLFSYQGSCLLSWFRCIVVSLLRFVFVIMVLFYCWLVIRVCVCRYPCIVVNLGLAWYRSTCVMVIGAAGSIG